MEQSNRLGDLENDEQHDQHPNDVVDDAWMTRSQLPKPPHCKPTDEHDDNDENQ